MKKTIIKTILLLSIAMVVLVGCGEKESYPKEASKKEKTSEDIYTQYKKILKRKEREYGQIEFRVIGKSQQDEAGILQGLCFAQLVDFAHDDVPELLIYHYDASAKDESAYDCFSEYKFEIYMQNSETGSVELVCEDTGLCTGTGEGASIEIYEGEEETYLVIGRAFESIFYGEKDGTIEKLISFKNTGHNYDEVTWYVDSKVVDQDAYMRELEPYQSGDVKHYDVQVIYITSQEELDDKIDALKVINETREKLGMESISCGYVNDLHIWTAEEIHNALVQHYHQEDPELIVMEGGFEDEMTYVAQIRCGVPGNAMASQRLYEVKVDSVTGQVSQTRVLTDNALTFFMLGE